LKTAQAAIEVAAGPSELVAMAASLATIQKLHQHEYSGARGSTASDTARPGAWFSSAAPRAPYDLAAPATDLGC
jgi:hypothetical protein